MSPPIAPGGFLPLGAALMRVKDRLRCNAQKAEWKIARAICEGRIGMARLPGLERVAPAESMEFDFINSRVIGAAGGDDRQVIHLHLGGLGNASVGFAGAQEAEPLGTLVVLDEDDVERLLNELAPPPAETTAPAQLDQPHEAADGAPASSRPAHRPPAYDWSWYLQQLRRRVYQYGLPDTSSTLVRELLQLFERRDEGPPAQRHVERKVAEWLPGLQKLVDDLVSLAEPCEITPEMPRRN